MTKTAKATAEATADATTETDDTSTAMTETASSSALVDSAVVSLEVPGMEGLELDFGSIPLIKLDKGEFICNEFEVPPSFDAVLLSSRPKYFYKCSDDDHPIPFFYTYDEKETVNGEPVEGIIETWREAGAGYKSSKYLEVLAKVLPWDGMENEQFVLLSISPRSVGRYTSYVALTLHSMGKKPQEVITTVGIGPRIESKFPFRPWDFSYKADL